ncbi:MAG: hypothetical protein K0R90_1339 [Oscillospiraceae bacterium]|nr:hypothetical protein [Oscillospiraceae bacterium]
MKNHTRTFLLSFAITLLICSGISFSYITISNNEKVIKGKELALYAVKYDDKQAEINIFGNIYNLNLDLPNKAEKLIKKNDQMIPNRVRIFLQLKKALNQWISI